MALFLAWIVFSFIIAAIGAEREIGGWAAFFISLLLSPVIGLIVVLVSKTKATVARERQMLIEQQNATNELREIKNSTEKVSVADELVKLKDLADRKVISDLEYEAAKKKLLG